MMRLMSKKHRGFRGVNDYFRGKHLVVINKSATAREVRAELTIAAPIGAVMEGLKV